MLCKALSAKKEVVICQQGMVAGQPLQIGVGREIEYGRSVSSGARDAVKGRRIGTGSSQKRPDPSVAGHELHGVCRYRGRALMHSSSISANSRTVRLSELLPQRPAEAVDTTIPGSGVIFEDG